MTGLVLLNGPPGVGKSTLAQMYVATRPLALNLDVDVVRGLLGEWAGYPREAGVLARDLAAAMATAHLAAGLDVVVPQYVARAGFLERLAAVGASAGASFVEVVVMDHREGVQRRIAQRPFRVDPWAAPTVPTPWSSRRRLK